jgi:hypothetical protein
MATMSIITKRLCVLPLALSALTVPVLAQHAPMPEGMTHEQHMAQMQKDAAMKEHGHAAMGFDQETTSHHFLIDRDGGAISVEVNNPADATGVGAIRAHLLEIAASFKAGDFSKPFLTHSEQPPGVAELQRLKNEMSYTYADTSRGGIVRIVTANTDALRALHGFLRYQIAEHKTGDPIVR